VSIKFAVRAAVAAAALGLIVMPTQANVAVGQLMCSSPGNSSFVVVSMRSFDCTFTPSAGGPAQHYRADINRFGAQIGMSNDVMLGWTVFSVTTQIAPGELAGGYGGVSAGATVGVGGSANVLLGGLNNSFALQPVSLQGQKGLDVVATVTGLTLSPEKAMRHHRKMKMKH
jgi:hypothetical protein